ncbi:serine hydrolase [Aureitalea marina]|uniref:Serine hydrolase n=1 Tax=Aureitalea marina TaxID=930804 RepID=A0A2S7KSY9_9FLAO|nr:serine hydrolase [Aureitalea marina]PQB05698.1 hypothetical protein BST85_12915 [Aureitalea marina]
MRQSISYFAFLFSFLLAPLQAQEIHLDSLDNFLEKVRQDFEVVGLSVGIVRNDTVIYAKGFGEREIGKSAAVSKETTFGIGSISKSFTVLTLGMLVEEGKIDWDDRVVDYLPYFELYDPYVSNNMTIRDLLTHRSGLPEVSGGSLWYHSDLDRVELIKGLKYLEPESGFREKPAYQNVMFVVASEIVKEVSGMSWDKFLQTRVLDPLKMDQTTSLAADREANNNLAQPHIWDEDFKKVAIVQEKGDNLAPGGFIYSSAKDMNNYMRLLLNRGVFQNDSLVGENILEEIFKPQFLYQISGKPFGNEFSSYGLGWWVTPHKGHKIIEHSGGIDGMSAQLFMIEDMNLGVVILTNVSKEPASFLIKAKLMEWIMDDPAFDFYQRGLEFRANRFDRLREEAANLKPKPNTRPSLSVQDYAGHYHDRMYGDISINQLQSGELELSFSRTPLFTGKLSHWHYDTFKIDWEDIRVPDGFLTFNFDSEMNITGFSLDQDNLLDVDFDELTILRKN